MIALATVGVRLAVSFFLATVRKRAKEGESEEGG